MTMQYETSPLNAALGLISGAVVGGVVFWAGAWASAIIVDQRPLDSSMNLISFLMLTALTAVIWLAGLLILACPIWFVLHRLQARGPLAAAMLGAVLSFLFFLFGAMTNWFGLWAPAVPIDAANLLDMDWRRGLEAAGWMTPLGTLVGLVVWRVAYWRVPPV